MKRAALMILGALLATSAGAGENGKSSARPLPEWATKILKEEYLGYKFELPPTVKKKHPRLPYPSEKALEWYRQNPKEQPVKHPVMMYLITKDKKRLDQIVEWMRGKNAPSGRNARYWRPTWALDWLYDELPEDARKAQMKKCRSADLGWADKSVRPTQGMFMKQCGLSGMAEAIVAWEPGDDEQLKAAHKRFFKDFVPMWHVAMGPDGGGLSLPAYLYVHSLENGVCDGMVLWSSFLGVDLFEKYAWLKPFGYQPMFMTLPHMGTAPLGDSSDQRGMKSGTPNKHGEVFAERYDDPYMRWYAHCLTGKALPQRPFFERSEFGMWREFDLRGKKARPIAQGFPAERFFGGGWGLVAMRSDWTEDATYALFRIGDVSTNHTHSDSGMFYIYRNGGLALDSGYYSPGPPHQKYSSLAIAHNVVTVRDPADKFVPNEGGQRAVSSQHYGSPANVEDYLVKRREIYETGDMIAYDPHSEYVYAAGNLTAAYQCALSGGADRKHLHRTRRLEVMTRAFLYIRPDYFAVFDRVAALKPEFQKRWLLHTSNKPKVNGDTLEVERNDTLCSKAGKYCAWDLPMRIQMMKHKPYRSSDPRFYQYKLHGKLFCKTLLPKEHKIELVGGPGKEFWADGKNYDMIWDPRKFGREQIPLVGDPTLVREVGAWRVEVKPKQNKNKEDFFLHVIQVGDSGTLKKMVPVEYAEAPGKVGFKMTAEGKTYTVLFDRSGIGGHITIAQGGKKLIDRDFATETGKNREPSGANGRSARSL